MSDFPDISEDAVDIDFELDAMSLDQQLDYTQTLRFKAVRTIAPDEVVPKDPKERRELMGVLDAIDNQVHARRQSDNDSKNADNNARVADFLVGLHALPNPDFHRQETPVERDVTPEFGEEADINPTEYMLSQEANAGDTNFAEFSKQFKEDNPEYDT